MEEYKHSGIGIASFIISILSGILTFALFIIAGIIESSKPGGMSEDSLEAIIIGLLVFAFTGAALISTGLGIAGILQKNKKKLFAILGTTFSSALLIIIALVIVIGLSME